MTWMVLLPILKLVPNAYDHADDDGADGDALTASC